MGATPSGPGVSARAWGRQLVDLLKSAPDAATTIVVALAAAVLGGFNVFDDDVERQLLLALIALVAFNLLIDRGLRRRSSERLQQLLDQVGVEGPAEADALFQRATAESDVVRDAQRELWLLQETGSMLLDRERSRLIAFVAGGGSLRVVLASPTRATAAFMALRNRDIDPDGFLARAPAAQSQLLRIVGGLDEEQAARVEVRYTPFPVDSTVVMADPDDSDHRRRRAVVRLAGFRLTYDSKPDFPLDGAGSPQTFELYRTQLEAYRDQASKVLLVSGSPGAGKTTLLQAVLEARPEFGATGRHLYFALTSEQRTGGERSGFDLVTSSHPEPRPLARKRAAGTYSRVETVVETLADEITEAHARGDVIVLDEIGPLQAASDAFRRAVEAVLDDPAASLVASVALGTQDPFVTACRRHPRATLCTLAADRSNRHACERLVADELEGSLRLASYLPRRLWTDA